MSRVWKVLVLLSLMLNGVCLLYLYAFSHPNPYGPQHYETEHLKLELRRVKDALCALSASKMPATGQEEKPCAE